VSVRKTFKACFLTPGCGPGVLEVEFTAHDYRVDTDGDDCITKVEFVDGDDDVVAVINNSDDRLLYLKES
jgi:hypothetical protein